MGLIITGRTLGVEEVQRTDNEGKAYSYWEAHILTGLEVQRVRLGDNFPRSALVVDQDMAAEFTQRAYPSRGGAGVQIYLQRPLRVKVEPVTPAAAPGPSAVRSA